MTLNVRPPTSTEHPIMIDRILSPEGRIQSTQTEAQITTTDGVVTVTSVSSVTTMSAVNIPTGSDTTMDEMTTTDADYDLPNMTDIVETGNGTTTMSRTVSSVVRDEVMHCEADLFCSVLLPNILQPQASDMIVASCLGAGTLIVFIALGVIFWLRKYKTTLASQLDDHNWIVAEIADMSVATMSDLMTRQTD